MQNNVEQLMTSTVAAIRAQLLAEMKTRVPAAAPRRRLLTAKESTWAGRSMQCGSSSSRGSSPPSASAGRCAAAQKDRMQAELDAPLPEVAPFDSPAGYAMIDPRGPQHPEVVRPNYKEILLEPQTGSEIPPWSSSSPRRR